MRSDELIAAVRLRAQLKDNHPDWTNAAILSEMNGVLQSTYAPAMLAARCGYLLKRFSQAMVAGTSVYPLPARAMAIEAVDFYDSASVEWYPLEPLDTSDVWASETATNNRPKRYQIVGSSVRLYPPPDAAYTLRMHYYLRPSRIVPHQSGGLITSLVQSTGSVEVNLNSAIYNKVTDVVLAGGDVSQYFDIVRGGSSSGTYGPTASSANELTLCEAISSNVRTPSTQLYFSSPVDYSEVRAGDWLRIANQSEWPTLPNEYHSGLATATAALICGYRGMSDLAKSLGGIVAGDLERMRHAIQPRVKSHAPKLVPRAHMLRRYG